MVLGPMPADRIVIVLEQKSNRETKIFGEGTSHFVVIGALCRVSKGCYLVALVALAGPRGRQDGHVSHLAFHFCSIITIGSQQSEIRLKCMPRWL